LALSDYQSKCTEISTYIDAENWAAAKKCTLQAMALAATIPESEKGDYRFTLRPEQLPALLAEIKAQLASTAASSSTDAGGMKVTKITWGGIAS